MPQSGQIESATEGMVAELNSFTDVVNGMRALLRNARCVGVVVMFAASPTVAETVKSVDVRPLQTAPISQVKPIPAEYKTTPTSDMRTRLRCRQGICVSVSEKTALPKPVAVEADGADAKSVVAPLNLSLIPDVRINMGQNPKD